MIDQLFTPEETQVVLDKLKSAEWKFSVDMRNMLCWLKNHCFLVQVANQDKIYVSDMDMAFVFCEAPDWLKDTYKKLRDEKIQSIRKALLG